MRSVLDAFVAVILTVVLEVSGAFATLGILVIADPLPRLTGLEWLAVLVLLFCGLMVAGRSCLASAAKVGKAFGFVLILLASMVVGLVGGFILQIVARHPPGIDYMGEVLSNPGAAATLVAGIMFRREPNWPLQRTGSILMVIASFLLAQLTLESMVEYFVKLGDLKGSYRIIIAFVVPLACAAYAALLLRRRSQPELA